MRPFMPRGLRPLVSSTISSSARTPSTRLFSSQLRHVRAPSTPLRAHPSLRRIIPPILRHNSSSSKPLTDAVAEDEAHRALQNEERRKAEAAYRISFTCKPCGQRSEHRMSKQGYHHGTVLIQSITSASSSTKSTTLEDLLKEGGQTITHGMLDGDMEVWEDGTLRKIGGTAAPEEVPDGQSEGEADKSEEQK
ncbi:hypothetical protein N7468_010634 [Penicillium chermesinum]|uniref:DNL-type domain-containing protein n=1 Tax=Penicillium chermesinum TaxID=63820 RepID=A0A9W9TAY7_9EURO|nr:uncharacterized protein N7468_010634 [Penicillium chermesinum]KAJ5214955.1 hypothetical protein N7468_010634 [Penicillium chermesinum]